MSDKFWAVWRETGGAPPSKRHPTKDFAVTEAGHLAQQTNERYFVLEVVSVSNCLAGRRLSANGFRFERDVENA